MRRGGEIYSWPRMIRGKCAAFRLTGEEDGGGVFTQRDTIIEGEIERERVPFRC